MFYINSGSGTNAGEVCCFSIFSTLGRRLQSVKSVLPDGSAAKLGKEFNFQNKTGSLFTLKTMCISLFQNQLCQ